jgi:hypothetical protein
MIVVSGVTTNNTVIISATLQIFADICSDIVR